MIALGRGGPLAVSYAIRHPKRVSHLFLWNTFAASREQGATARDIVNQLMEHHWDLFTEIVSGMAFGFGEFAAQYAEYFRASITHDEAMFIYRAIDQDDVEPLLPRIEVPTLVIQHDGVADRPIDMGRNLASRIPKARLIVVGGTWVHQRLL